MRKIGVLTAGGDCPGLNAAIRAVVKTAQDCYQTEVVGIHDSFLGLLPGGVKRTINREDVRGILDQGGTILGTTNRGPFNLDESMNPRPEAMESFRTALSQFRDLELEGLVVIGGDGSLRIGLAFQRLGMPIVGVPKTIDNDLEATDRTFGFDTAVNIASDALDRLHTVAAAHHRVMVCEVMGREAGWIALHAGLASGADAILIPEIPFHWEPLRRMVSRRRLSGITYSLVVAAEGCCEAGGCPVYQADGRLGGIGEKIGADLTATVEVETRVTILGHVQRGGKPTAYDRVLASRLGEAAVHLAAQGKYGRVVVLHAEAIEDVALEEAVARNKLVQPDGQMVRAGRSCGVTFGDEVR